jgi:hypothetical protein
LKLCRRQQKRLLNGHGCGNKNIQAMNQRRIYLTLYTVILLFGTLVYVPRKVFHSPPRIEWSIVFGEPEIRDSEGNVIGSGYMLSEKTLFIEWAVIGAVYAVLIAALRTPKKIQSRIPEKS